MKCLLISGTHSRHLFVHRAVLATDVECAAIVMQRESVVPQPPPSLTRRDRENFVRHFDDRLKIEKSVFGDPDPRTVFADCPTFHCSAEELNSDSAARFASRFAADIAFIFGPDLIKEPLLGSLPRDRVNLHLGLSPWYRGSATLFWPFYFLEPQFAGATFHQIVARADAGSILHQCVPVLEAGDGIHDVGARTVEKARIDLKKLLLAYEQDGGWQYQPQRTAGRLFLTKDFHPVHLRVIYDLFNNAIVDEFLTGRLPPRSPELVQYENC